MVIQLELCIIVQLLHSITTGFRFDIKEKQRQKNQHKYATTGLITTRKGSGMVLILISHYDRCASKAYYAIVIKRKIKKYSLLMVIKLKLYKIVVQKHKKATEFIDI